MNHVKKRRPLQRTISLTMISGAIALLLMAGVVVLLLYPYAIVKSIKVDTENDMNYVITISEKENLDEIYARTKEIYYGMPDEVRDDPFSVEFMRCFRDLSRDPKYIKLRSILQECRKSQKLSTIAFCFFDEKNKRIVYVVDGDKIENSFIPGQWITDGSDRIDPKSEIDRIIASDWYMALNWGSFQDLTIRNYLNVISPSGHVIGFAYTDVKVSDAIKNMMAFTVIYMVLMVMVIAVMMGFLANFLKSRVTIPIGRLSDSATAYTHRDKAQINDGQTASYFAKLNIDTGDEIEALWTSLVGMEEDMTDTLKRIRDMTAARERFDTELAIANQIQSDMLPRKFPAFPDRSDFSLFATMHPAREVGGDFYDFFLTDDDHIALVIADVSDKGVPAALFMMTARTLIKHRAMTQNSTSEILKYANAELCAGNEAALFVTVWLAIIELSTGKGRASNAGHMNPALSRKGEAYKLIEYNHSLPLGVLEDADFEEHGFDLKTGDRLFVYTDGVTDIEDAEGRQFGTDGMMEALNSIQEGSPEETVEYVMDSIKRYSAGAVQVDDITMLHFYYEK